MKAPSSPALAAFHVSAHLAENSRVSTLEQGALDVDREEFGDHLGWVRKALAAAYEARGSERQESATVLLMNGADPLTLEAAINAELSIYQAAGYLYGMAVGMMLGRRTP